MRRQSEARLLFSSFLVLTTLAWPAGGRPSKTPAGLAPARIDSTITKASVTPARPTIVPRSKSAVAAPSPIASLVQAIVQAPDLKSATKATEQALARGGVATTDIRTVYVPAAEPGASMVASPLQALSLAVEARKRATVATLSVDELGRALREFGMPFPAGRAPGDVIIKFFSLWVSGAQKKPQDPLSFTPLFIAEMAKRQAPAVDLASGQAKPSEVRLSLLELILFAAAFDRGTTRKSSLAPASAVGQTWRYTNVRGWMNNFSPRPDEGGPCALLKQRFGVLGIIQGQSTEPGAIKVLEEAEGVEKEEVEITATSLKVLGIMARIWQLIAAYRYGQIEVSLVEKSKNPLHKPLAEETTTENQLRAGFVAQVGISDKDWEEYQNSIAHDALDSEIGQITRECLETLGFPSPKTLEDMAEDATNWTIRWVVVQGNGDLAEIDDDATDWYLPGNHIQKPVKSGEHSAQATVVVKVETEKKAEHPGTMSEGEFVIRAEANTSPGLTAETIKNAIVGTVEPWSKVEALIDISAGWLQTMLPIKGYGSLTVTWHKRADILLDIHSEITEYGHGKVEAHVNGTVPLTCESIPKQESVKCTGQAPIDLIRFSYPSECKWKVEPQTTPFKVLSLTLDPSTGGGGIVMQLEPGIDNEVCYAGRFRFTNHTWASAYDVLRGASNVEEKKSAGDLTIRDWTLMSSPDHPIYARKTFNRKLSQKAGSIWENTILELRVVSHK